MVHLSHLYDELMSVGVTLDYAPACRRYNQLWGALRGDRISNQRCPPTMWGEVAQPGVPVTLLPVRLPRRSQYRCYSTIIPGPTVPGTQEANPR